ncbi:hypothetical protein LWI28_028080 [Acer negundo]|uniref:NusG-like N-terminal domain-containing protein n=1 Tax=Acer negundo TaxID=4023 RepID=A0AAD5I8F4_ACENE|nr:hypothetical protein LWI28_028080 [Acer negundo]KAK4857535.1 hypothetical protein QYF36_002156 [Acer negundo]
MKQGLLLWSPCHHLPSLSIISISFPIHATKYTSPKPISATLDSTATTTHQELSARERRQLRNERRERKTGQSWKEEVEEKLLKKPKKRYATWTEELNLDNLADSGPQWWVVRVTRLRYEEISEKLARSLVRNFPDMEFKMYAPAVQVKRKLKNGTYSVKPKPIFPGCIFLRCVLNKEVHDSIRECDGVGGFVGSKVGNTKRQINRPRPVSPDDMEAIFQEAKVEQEKVNQAFEEEQRVEGALELENLNIDMDDKPKRQSRKASAKGDKLPAPGSTVRLISGTFAEFEGSLKKLNRKTGKATVAFTLFGKESLVEVDLNEIAAETK